MKVYKKCEKCGGDGYINHQEGTADFCDKCQTAGYIETEIPLEQCVEALKASSKALFNPDTAFKSAVSQMQSEAIKAAEAVLNETR